MPAEFVGYAVNAKYQVYVTWVDHSSFVQDDAVTPALDNMTMTGGTNFFVSGFRLDGAGESFKYNIVVPQELQGSFKVPQPGDVITVEEQQRQLEDSPIYVYSLYNQYPFDNRAASHVPKWGNLPGDYGHLRSHREHNTQFHPLAEPGGEPKTTMFIKRYIKSITGYRFRKYYGHLYGTQDRFVLVGKNVIRGDNVFDILQEDSKVLMSRPMIDTELGMDIVPLDGNTLSSDYGTYPSPINVPTHRTTDSNYVYASPLSPVLDKLIESDVYKGVTEIVNPKKHEYYRVPEMFNRNYLAYQPIVDKKYFDTTGKERELPAAEEYQLALRGNNKLLIQDPWGDGEQILITLKNQYDASLTILHNVHTGQVRLRDHLGQGVLLESNPWAPRVVAWTTERQVVDMGSVRDYDPKDGETESHGEYFYIRNGPVYGMSDTEFGRLPESEIPRDGDDDNAIPQQELTMVSARESGGWEKMVNSLTSRLSKGMDEIVKNSAGSGLFFRNNHDPLPTSQTFRLFNDFSPQPVLTAHMNQIHKEELNGKVIFSDIKHVVDDSMSTGIYDINYEDGTVLTKSHVSSVVDVAKSETLTSSSFEGESKPSTLATTRTTTDEEKSEVAYLNSFTGETTTLATTQTTTNVLKSETVQWNSFAGEGKPTTLSTTRNTNDEGKSETFHWNSFNAGTVITNASTNNRTDGAKSQTVFTSSYEGDGKPSTMSVVDVWNDEFKSEESHAHTFESDAVTTYSDRYTLVDGTKSKESQNMAYLDDNVLTTSADQTENTPLHSHHYRRERLVDSVTDSNSTLDSITEKLKAQSVSSVTFEEGAASTSSVITNLTDINKADKLEEVTYQNGDALSVSFSQVTTTSDTALRHNKEQYQRGAVITAREFVSNSTETDTITLTKDVFQNADTLSVYQIDTESDSARNYVRNLSNYLAPGVSSKAEMQSITKGDMSDMQTAVVWDGASGTSAYHEQHTADASKSRSRTYNSFLGDSEATGVTTANLGGTVNRREELRNLKAQNAIVIESNPDVRNKITQIRGNLTVNTFEMLEDSVTTTQYAPPDTPNNEVKQTAAGVDISRLLPGLTINIGSGDVGTGTINVGNLTDSINVYGSSVGITSAAAIGMSATTSINLSAVVGISSVAPTITMTGALATTVTSPLITLAGFVVMG